MSVNCGRNEHGTNDDNYYGNENEKLEGKLQQSGVDLMISEQSVPLATTPGRKILLILFHYS